jgi:DUF1680 family protein
MSSRNKPISLSDFQVNDAFWSPRIKLLSEVTLPQQYDQIANQTPRLENFRKAARRENGGFEGRYYDDSDTYKWLEACAYALTQSPNSKLQAMCDEVISLMVAAQEPDGYLNTFFQLNHPGLKFRNLSMMHEMYCMGHFIEAAVAWSEALDDDRLLASARKTVALLISTFLEDDRVGYCGHEEIEHALLRYAQHTGDEKARELAIRMIESRGQNPSPFEAEWSDVEAIALSPWSQRMLGKEGNYSGEYVQDHLPIREHSIVVGHAVRAMYLYMAAAQVADSDEALKSALQAVWYNMTQKRMYITGGIGSTATNEGFTNDYDLPNYNSYAETCASVGLAMWGRQMALLFQEGDYADAVERAIFNGALSGISLTGDKYFYANPLESRADHTRVPWFECACCPPNIARMIGSISQYALSVSDGELTINFPIGGSGSIEAKGTRIGFSIKTEHPYGSKTSISFSMEKPAVFRVRIRYPDWSDSVTCTIEGNQVESEYENGFIVLDRQWSPGEKLEIELEMEPKWIRSHSNVFSNLGKVALMKGPLVYCLETKSGLSPAQHFFAFTEEEVECGTNGNLIVSGGYLQSDPNSGLYESGSQFSIENASAEFSPYFAWGNNGPAHMAVWVNEA